MDYISTRAEGLSALKSKLNDIDPRIIVYDYEFKTHDGRCSDKMLAIVYIGENVNNTNKIATTYAFEAFKQELPGTLIKEAQSEDDLDDIIPDEEFDPSRL